MTEREINVLYDACKASGTDPSRISDENPFTKQGKTAQALQIGASMVDPEQAAIWRLEAGARLSVMTRKEVLSGQPLSQKAQQDLWEHDPKYVVQSIQERKQEKVDLDKWLEQEADATRLRNKMLEVGGNEARAKQALAREDAANQQRELQKQQAAEHARQFEQRMAQQRQQAARMAGVFTNS